ncbi:MAG: CRTAC1 family protein [Acidobacteria bacterium]|nr:CRTAC1 family protein [Acidobacteriota bacterium]MBI3425503.1 CRTAC1 family protein [Acidobacteriota bacterium]
MKSFASLSCVLALLITSLLVSACHSTQAPAPTTGSTPLPASTVATPAQAEAAPSVSPSPVGLPPLPAKFADVTFSDVTGQAGIKFRHNNGAYGKKYLPETMGAGGAWLDYDNDGWPDVLLINGMDFPDAPPQAKKPRRSVLALYHNNQNGTFTDVAAAAGLAKPMYGMGAAIGDYDNDGNVDIFVTALGQNYLFRNLGGGKFADVTAKLGLDKEKEFSTSAAWFDYDKDGKLDLFVCNYVDWQLEKDLNCSLDGTNKSYCTPESYKGQPSRLYRNTGGKFEDVSEKAGIFDPTSKAMGVAITDYNKDGWPDVFVSNDTQPNKLYKNNGNGTFSETAVTAGIAFSDEGKARAGMGVDFADYDGSGFPSVIIGNFSNEMLAVYHNEGKAGLFIDESPSSNIGQATLLSLTFGLFFFDYDLDGKPDIFLANGHVADDINAVQPKITYAMAPKLFHNDGKRKFTETTRKAGKPFVRPIVARGAAYADYDNDGDLDVLVTTNGGPAYLLRNEGGNQQRFVRFKTSGDKANRDGIGSKITVFAGDGSKQWQVVHSGSSYCSQSELTLTFGLGRNDKIDHVEIEWPNNTVEVLKNVAINQLHMLKEGKGIAESRPLPLATPTPIISPSASPLAQVR